MLLIIAANKLQRDELSLKKVREGVELVYIESTDPLYDYSTADAVLILDRVITHRDLLQIGDKTIFLNSVPETLSMLGFPKNVIRINGWRTFLKNEVWEIAAQDEQIVKETLSRIGWRYILVADDPGLISARIIAMIINEAYFALGDEVSSKKEIDIAMKLGTNYPYGPFEWSEQIGLKNIHSLLTVLMKNDSRYEIAPALVKELSFIL
jgi:3-hydroxybutyryl-CoA dehydrogenase